MKTEAPSNVPYHKSQSKPTFSHQTLKPPKTLGLQKLALYMVLINRIENEDY